MRACAARIRVYGIALTITSMVWLPAGKGAGGAEVNRETIGTVSQGTAPEPQPGAASLPRAGITPGMTAGRARSIAAGEPGAAVYPMDGQRGAKFENDPNVVGRELNGLVAQALGVNPTLAAARYAVVAAQARVPQAGMPADPLLGFRIKDMPTTFSWVRENATEKQIEFQQSYPFPGKLGLREEIAGKEALVARADEEVEAFSLVDAVRLAFIDIFVVDKNIGLTLERQAMLRDLRDIATSKYQVGPGLQQDVLNADVALARLHSTLIELARRRESREIRLGVLLDRPSVAVNPLGVLPAGELTLEAGQIEEMALAANPRIRRLAQAVARDELTVALARRAPLPDMEFDADYGLRNDATAFSAGKANPVTAVDRPDLLGARIMFDVPVFYYWKQREQLAEVEANLNRTRSRLMAERDQTLGTLHDLMARYRQHAQVARSFEQEVLPLAHSSLAAAVSAYQVDKVDFLTVLAAEEELNNYEADYWNNLAERFRDLVQIDDVAGGSVLAAGGARP